MPNRILRESILTSQAVNSLDASEERFYRHLMSVVDDFGCYDARPGILRAACFPAMLDKVRDADISRWMAACQKAGLILVYEADSKSYLKLLKLGEPRAKRSKYPQPIDNTKPARTCAQMNADAPVFDSALRLTPTPFDSPLPPASGGNGGGRKVRERRKPVGAVAADDVENIVERLAAKGIT